MIICTQRIRDLLIMRSINLHFTLLYFTLHCQDEHEWAGVLYKEMVGVAGLPAGRYRRDYVRNFKHKQPIAFNTVWHISAS